MLGQDERTDVDDVRTLAVLDDHDDNRHLDTFWLHCPICRDQARAEYGDKLMFSVEAYSTRDGWEPGWDPISDFFAAREAAEQYLTVPGVEASRVVDINGKVWTPRDK